ncbi:methyltransferase domain-containing protein [Spirillospora sp. CA-294931]|uniref:methyltransferase domain-containing protein n=1 Tax=Spirillospora sp. CA-294931 TaxID=3240042 RepID=UPI003D911ABC
MTRTATCQVCGGLVEEFLDLGRQPISQRFREPSDTSPEVFFRLAAGQCGTCAMVQLTEAVPREEIFHDDYPFASSQWPVMARYFAGVADELLRTGPDPFVVEIGCNDGVMLGTVARAGVRHLGFEPSGGVAVKAREAGVRVRQEFFEERTAGRVAAEEGPADVIYSANVISHIPYLASILRGVDALLAPGGVFVFEDVYLGDIVANTAFDQIFDEHFYLFSAHSVGAAASRFGLELVDVKRVPFRGGEMRYTLARAGARRPSGAVAELLAEERSRELTAEPTLRAFRDRTMRICDELVDGLTRLRRGGTPAVGYGATVRSATLLNFCAIGPDLVPFICDATPSKVGRLTPGTHIPVRPLDEFSRPYPSHALLFAWEHGDEIVARERDFRRAGGRWLRYVPEVHLS